MPCVATFEALVGLRGAMDYPIAVGVVKTLTTKTLEYVSGRPREILC